MAMTYRFCFLPSHVIDERELVANAHDLMYIIYVPAAST